MSEVLDQSEIDALLASVGDDSDSAEIAPAPTAGAPHTPARSKRARVFAADLDAHLYDFKRPERVSKDQIRALSSIHEVFARNFGATLSGMLRTIIDLRVVGVEQLTYNEFIHSLPNPTCFMTLEAPPLEGQMCLELSPLIVFPIVDRLLGGSNSELYLPQRPPTSIEWRLMRRIVERGLDHLSEVWRNLVDAQFKLVAEESNPQLVHIVAPTEIVVFITFEIKFGHNAGTMSLCVPFNTIESVLSHLTTQSWFFRPKPATERHQARLLRGLNRGRVELVANLGVSSINMSQMRNLRAGDLIPLDKSVDMDLVLQVEGRNKFAGKVGQHRGRRALRITRPAIPDEPL